MSPSMDWLYSYYIMPIIEGTPPGEYAENFDRLKAALDIPLETDLERALEWYAGNAFRLGLRTGLALRDLAADEQPVCSFSAAQQPYYRGSDHPCHH